MVELVVSEEQAKLLAEATESVAIVDAAGNRLGFFARRFSDQDVAAALRRAGSHQPGRSTVEVLGCLQTSGER